MCIRDRYQQDVLSDELVMTMKALMPDFADDIDHVLHTDRCTHPPNYIDFSADDALRHVVQILTRIFPECQEEPLFVLDACSADSEYSRSDQPLAQEVVQ
eukprot:TRINITY_DN1333_c0_g1_i1.p1 TRINITY_DN1333_c0_g1~~TRINITY_DN1333_c0_g1_i1.p1  ORF type:complete len:100 (+),score=24.04 TRINITY_DN1333_c0_g1_i1:183-482(+)